jgi:leader peptidase (prepilin peptidase)/N-methyltransferase
MGFYHVGGRGVEDKPTILSQQAGRNMIILLIILFGLAMGILVNGLADHLPEMGEKISLSETLPSCSHCGGIRKWSDLSSLVSILLRGGECARCGAPRGLRDLIVESVCGIAIPALWIGGVRSPVDFLSGTLVLTTFLLITVIDFEHRSVILGILICFSILFTVFTALKGFSGIPWILLGCLSGLAIMFLFYILGWILARGLNFGGGLDPLGSGDVWLGGVVGMVSGWPAVVPAVILAIFMAGFYGLCVMILYVIRGKPARNVTIAYGPFLLLSGVLFYFSAGFMIERFISLW